MEERRSWLRENWRIGLVLVLILGLAMFLRTYFVYSEFAPAGYWTHAGDYSGGSDPFYWERALLYSFQTGKEISWDYAMNYPIGFPDVRPPLFDWFNLLGGYVAAPFFSGNAWNAMVWMLNMNAAIFGVLSLIPTYLIGKEAFNKRAGILAALLLAISAAALSRSHATIAVHDSWTLFFVICTFYFYLRALKTLNRKRWVENWFQRSSVLAGLKTFLRENRKSVLYAFLAGLSVGVTALSWQGWAYVPVILVLTYVVEVLLDRIRNQDAMGVTILFLIILAVPLLISLPWYAVRNLIKVWWDVPFYLFLVAAALGIVFTVTRDYPWTIIIPGTFIAGAAGLLVGFTVNPSLLYAFYSGAGYFVKNKVYETIAEAQEPGMSELILSFGMFTFGIGLIAIGYLIWQLPKRNNPAYTMLVLWTFGALFMAFSAARFIFNAAPVMAIATGYAIDVVLARMGFAEMKRTYHSLAEGSWRNALRKSVKPRHVLVILVLVVIVLLPNVWFAVDSGIPYDLKSTYDRQIENALPSFLQAPGFNSVSGGNTFYLGAFGYSLPKSTDYFPAAYAWLDTQDTGVPLNQRPAVLAWWDYGFEITERGGHPVVADPFQNGYGISGQFILAQNESSAIALMTTRLLEGDFRAHYPSLSPGVAGVLQAAGIDPAQVKFAFKNGAALIPVVLGNPGLYGLWDLTLTAVNTPYIYLDALLLQKLTEDQLVSLYAQVSATTGTSIGYFMVDTRLFPLSASNTGIFYAPAKLSDHRTLNLANGQVLPYDFFQIFANTSQAQNIPIQFIPPNSQVTAETISFQPMFYDSMFYRAYVGYPPSVVGSADKGVPGLDQALAGYAPMPAWNMTHFRVVYRTAYYNPYKDPTNHTTAWQAVNYDQGQALQRQISAGKATGVVDLGTTTDIQNGAVILRYYPGAYVNGTVSVNGVPLAHVHVTVRDELGTPHGVTTTDASGHYSLLAPFGNVTIAASAGPLNNLTLVGGTTLASTTFPVSVAQANRANQDLNGDGVPDWLITKDLAVPVAAVHGTVFLDLNHDGALDPTDLVVPAATLRFSASALGLSQTVTTDPAGGYSFSSLAAGAYSVTLTTKGHTVSLPSLQVSGGTSLDNLAVPFQTIRGSVVDANGTAIAGAGVALTDSLNRTTWSTTSNATGGYAFSPVFAGDYSLNASLGETASLPLRMTLGASEADQNLTLLPSGRVSGSTQLFGLPLPYATLQFQSTSAPFDVATVTADGNGAYGLALPAGDWDVNGRVYQGTALYATLGKVTVSQGTSASFNANFVDGARLSGSVSAVGQGGDLRALLGFVGTSGEWWIRSALGNTYIAYLPQGTYSLVASTPQNAYTTSLSLTGSRTLNLDLVTATLISGTAYWDMNRNGVLDRGEGVPGARIALTDDAGTQTVGYSDASGAFQLSLLSNRTYSGTVLADGFAPFAINASTPAEIGPNVTWALTPDPVALVGTVSLNGTALLNRALALHAVAIGGGAISADGTTFSDGTFSLSLTPGRYLLEVDENVTASNRAWRYQNLGTDTIALPVGASQVGHDLVIVARARVQGNVTLSGVANAATVSFQGPDDRSVSATASGYSVYLQAGTYSVRADRAVSGAQYTVLENATLPLAGNLTLTLKAATHVNGLVTFGGTTLNTAMDLRFVRQEGGSFQALSTQNGTYAAYLPSGNYTVSVDAPSSVTVNGVTQYFLYSFLGSLTVPPAVPSLTYDVPTDRSFDNTTLGGTVAFAGGGVDASLSFIARSGGAMNASTASATNGSYGISLAPGTYALYATRIVGSEAFLGLVTVPHASTIGYAVTLVPAYTLNGVTTDPSNARVPSILNVTGGATLSVSTDASGNYAVLLPGGNYAITASRSHVEQGVTVSYQGSASFDLTGPTLVNLQLGRVDTHAAALTWDSTQTRTVQPGGSVTYTVVVQNTGNVQDSYTLAGSAAGWSFSFFPSSVTLDYGSAPNATSVQVTIQSPAGALVDHGAITITATSTKDLNAKGSVTVNVGIARVRGLTLQVDPLSGTFDGTYLNYTVNVRNTGNAPETVDVGIQNPSDVQASGWSPALARSGAKSASGLAVTGLNVSANSTAALKLVLRIAGANGGTTVALQVAAADSSAVSAQTVFTATLPQLTAPSGIGVTGSGILLELPPNEVLLAILIGGLAAAAAALFVTRRRR